MVRTIIYVVLGIVGIVALFAASGFLMPRNHQARASALIRAPQAKVWTLVADLSRAPEWMSGVRAMTPEPAENGMPTFRQTGGSGDSLFYVTRESVPPTRVVREVRDPGGNFGGTWTIELAPEGESTRVTIVEDGWIAFAPFRPVQQLLIGFDSTMKAYLADLARAAEKSEAEQ
jgi:uncharacterized protein YndB with AHSA1/START domain